MKRNGRKFYFLINVFRKVLLLRTNEENITHPKFLFCFFHPRLICHSRSCDTKVENSNTFYKTLRVLTTSDCVFDPLSWNETNCPVVAARRRTNIISRRCHVENGQCDSTITYSYNLSRNCNIKASWDTMT